MRGTEITDAQMETAEKFVLLVRSEGNNTHPDPEDSVSMPWHKLVRLVAWYGAIRANAVANGNPADKAGETYKTEGDK